MLADRGRMKDTFADGQLVGSGYCLCGTGGFGDDSKKVGIRTGLFALKEDAVVTERCPGFSEQKERVGQGVCFCVVREEEWNRG
jgi:hypothetical protein